MPAELDGAAPRSAAGDVDSAFGRALIRLRRMSMFNM